MRHHQGRRRVLSSAMVAATALVATTIGFSPPAVAAPPSNDDIANATVISDLPFTDTADTTEATVAPGDGDCGAATVWYAFTPTTDGTYEFDTIGSDYDTMLAVYAGSPDALLELACSDDDVGTQSRVVVDLSGGATYFISAGTCCEAIVGQVGPGGSLVLNADTATPLELGLTVSDRVRISATDPTTAIVSGTVSCNQAAAFSVSGTLTQRQGLNVVRSDVYTDGSCSAGVTPWSATVYGWSRVWLPKRATLTVGAFGCGVTCVSVDATTLSVRLVR